jgi:hypothetical protein
LGETVRRNRVHNTLESLLGVKNAIVGQELIRYEGGCFRFEAARSEGKETGEREIGRQLGTRLNFIYRNGATKPGRPYKLDI